MLRTVICQKFALLAGSTGQLATENFMDKNHYYKKYTWEAVERCCILILGFTPFAYLIFDDASLARGIALMIFALVLLVVSINVRAGLLAKEDEHTR